MDDASMKLRRLKAILDNLQGLRDTMDQAEKFKDNMNTLHSMQVEIEYYSANDNYVIRFRIGDEDMAKLFVLDLTANAYIYYNKLLDKLKNYDFNTLLGGGNEQTK